MKTTDDADAPQTPPWLEHMLAAVTSGNGSLAAVLDAAIAHREAQVAALRAVRSALAGPPPVAAPMPPEGRKPRPPKPDAGRASVAACRMAPEKLTLVRAKLLDLIATHGPKGASALRELAAVGHATVYAALEHPWFSKEPDGYHLSAEGYSARRGEYSPQKRAGALDEEE